MSVWRGGVWRSQAFPGGSGVWRGGAWASQRSATATQVLRNLLFGAGQQGVMYVPQPTVDGEQVLFQDSAGTTPVTADGQPVGYIKDLSGNGNHATRTTAAAKPIYRTDGTLHWLEFDGVDDFLESSLVTLTDRWAVSWAGSYNSYEDYHGPWRMLRDGGAPTSAFDNRLEEYTRSKPERAIHSRYEMQGATSDRGAIWPAVGTDVVGWANRNPGEEEALGELFTGSSTQKINDLLPYSEGTARLSLFRGYTGDFMPGKMYGYVFVVGGATVPSRESLNQYTMGLAGVTL